MDNVVRLKPTVWYEGRTWCDHCNIDLVVTFNDEDLWVDCPNCGLATNTPDMRPAHFIVNEDEFY